MSRPDEQPQLLARSDHYYAIVPEWLIYADISDRALRLYAVLARHADQQTHISYPSRRYLAEKLRCSVDSIDRATKELVDVEAVTVEKHRTDAGDWSSNTYQLHPTPSRSRVIHRGSRIRAAT